MQEFKNKSDYSVTVFAGPLFLVKVQFVDDLYSLARWLDETRNYSNWTTLNVYARRSRRFITQVRKGNPFPPRPR